VLTFATKNSAEILVIAIQIYYFNESNLFPKPFSIDSRAELAS